MSEVIVATKQTAKAATKPNTSNPLVQFGAGGIGASGGVWVYAKIYGFVANRFPSLLGNKYSIPVLKAVSALLLYSLGKTKIVRSIPMAKTILFGAGIGIFGSMVSDYVLRKFNPGSLVSRKVSTDAEIATNPSASGNTEILELI